MFGENEYSPEELFYLQLVDELEDLSNATIAEKLLFLDEKRTKFPKFHNLIEHAVWELDIDQGSRFPGKLDQFKIIRKLEEGGMGTLFLAEQLPFGRLVALKTISPFKYRLQSSESYQDRIGTAQRLFSREQKILSSLHLTNVIPILAAGECEGIAYFAMPYIEGVSLAKLIKSSQISSSETSTKDIVSLEEAVKLSQADKNGPGDTSFPQASADKSLHALEIRSVIQLLVDLLSSLDRAHKQGVIHRDIKPDNIMIRNDGQAFLIDFGIARLASESNNVQFPPPVDSSKTSHAGTWHYMAPEHLRGNAGPQSDIWSMGVVLYQVLTQRRPLKAINRSMMENPSIPQE